MGNISLYVRINLNVLHISNAYNGVLGFWGFGVLGFWGGGIGHCEIEDCRDTRMSADQSAGTAVLAARGNEPEQDQLAQVSIVVPLYNEEENVDPVVEELLSVLDTVVIVAELILVDDRSRDATGERAFAWQHRDRRVKVLQFRRNFGQTAAITAGFNVAEGTVVIVMDGDQQNDPRDIVRLLEEMERGYDVVSGWRVNRKDKLILRKLPSRLANRLISRTTGTELHDYGCTFESL